MKSEVRAARYTNFFGVKKKKKISILLLALPQCPLRVAVSQEQILMGIIDLTEVLDRDQVHGNTCFHGAPAFLQELSTALYFP